MDLGLDITARISEGWQKAMRSAPSARAASVLSTQPPTDPMPTVENSYSAAVPAIRLCLFRYGPPTFQSSEPAFYATFLGALADINGFTTQCQAN